MSKRIQQGTLQVDPFLAEFINTQLLPELGLAEADFWLGFKRKSTSGIQAIAIYLSIPPPMCNFCAIVATW